jgi:hypothetical protein
MRAIMSAAVLLFVAAQPRSAQESLRFLRAVELPRVEGRIDHLALDLTGQKLFVAALGNNTVEVVDLKTGTYVTSLRGFREPQGIAAVPDAKVIGAQRSEIRVYEVRD